MHEHRLVGCRPVPLAAYLKGLAVLRLVGEQADDTARGYWTNDVFVLRSSLDRSQLSRFFLDRYRPTPVVAPWNGGSGFHPKDYKDAITRVADSGAPRLRSFVDAIHAARALLGELGISEKAATDRKRELLEACRARLPDATLDWLDAAFVLSTGGPKFPPLLGTGGNDGRFDFSNNFMQRLLDVMDPETGAPTPAAESLLDVALFDAPGDGLTSGAIGQFLPSGAGGANAGTGFDGSSVFNPWDYVLMIEGAVMFAAAAVRRFEREGDSALSYPFTVRASAVGYPSAAASEASRGEMWLPLWSRPATRIEIKALLAEGRARVSRRTARNGVDFARAVATLGVDRGITEFQRFGFHVRNGLAYLATPLDRFVVGRKPEASLLDDIDGWLDVLRRRAHGKNAPNSVRSTLSMLDEAIVEFCRHGGRDRFQHVLVCLGACERALARSWKWAAEAGVKPVPPLDPAKWIEKAQDGSPEFRLACSLASISGDKSLRLAFRQHMEPVDVKVRGGRLRAEWADALSRDVVWSAGDLVGSLNAILSRRLIKFREESEARFDGARVNARLQDIGSFIARQTDDRRIEDLLWGCILVDWARPMDLRWGGDDRSAEDPVPALYALMKLCLSGRARTGDSDRMPLVPRVHRLAAAGLSTAASEAAARRLFASGCAPAVRVVHASSEMAQRCAAALMWALDDPGIKRLEEDTLRPSAESSQKEEK